MIASKRDSWEVLAFARFVLAFIVMDAHLPLNSSLDRWTQQIDWLGAPTAVLGFLIISGYSIAHSYTRNPVGYFGRRVLRIYPLYALAVLYTFIVISLVGGFTMGFLAGSTVQNLLFLQTYTCRPIPGNIALWSLPTEVTFYLLTPGLARLGVRPLIAITAILAAAYAIYPIVVPHVFFGEMLHGRALLFVGWAWMAGFLFHRCRDHSLSAVLLMAITILLGTINRVWNTVYSPITLVFVCLAVAASGSVLLRGWLKWTCNFLGDLSYPLYLFHLPTCLCVATLLHNRNAYVQIAASLVIASLALGIDCIVKTPLRNAMAVLASRRPQAIPA